MTYREFAYAVIGEVNKKLEGGDKARIYFAEKNNGIEKIGILIENPKVNISPTIYLEEYYRAYLAGHTLLETADEVIGFYRQIRREDSWEKEKILTYEGVKDRIVFRLVNTEKNRKNLDNIPHMPFLDLSIIFYVLLEVTEEGTAAMNISNAHMEHWKVDTENLWNDAVINCRQLLPAEFFTMKHALREILATETCSEDVILDDNLVGKKNSESDGMYVLTNKYRNSGAACIAYPHIADMIGRILKSDYYILPSSVHELIIVPYSEILNYDEINDMIREINITQVAAEEVLSDHAYFYDRRTGKVELKREDK